MLTIQHITYLNFILEFWYIKSKKLIQKYFSHKVITETTERLKTGFHLKMKIKE